ncbi:MAG: diaminopimelate decarboxylase [Deltaproteobacteria bacterium]|nr:diaminopimelate decarboxylase [Deltaproteobacteria bacterium]
MHDFQYADGALHCEGVSLAAVAEAVGTPFYCYSHRTFVNHYRTFDSAFQGADHLVCYSVKVNSNLAILHALFREGAGADIVSGGELYRALKAGADPRKIVYSGVGKREDEIRYALQSGILMFNVESPLEMLTIDRIAGEIGEVAPVSIRVNPDVDPLTHPYISTGLRKNKFGIAIERALVEYRHAQRLANVRVVGVDCHIGSQITQLPPFVDALERLRGLIGTLRAEGFEIRYLDVGGGLGIPYSDENAPHPTEYGQAVLEATAGLGCTLIMEPGRVIAGNAGVLVSRVLYTKESEEKRFVIADAAMNDLVRPSLYGSFHAIRPLREAPETVLCDLVGPICESGDFLAKDRRMADLKPGDLFAVMSAGAYGFIMGSNYNSRPRVAEVLVQGDRFWVIRRRERYEDLVRGEEIPPELN